MLCPGDICFLHIGLAGRSLASLAASSGPAGRSHPRHESELIYQTGVAFEQVSHEVRTVLAAFVEDAPRPDVVARPAGVG
jgi:hypothetical protein